MSYPLLQFYYDSAWNDVADMQLLSLVQKEANLVAGTLSLSFELINDLELAKDDQVALRIKQDAGDAGTVLFVGNVTARQVTQEQTVGITASNAWDELNSLIYETTTALGDDKYSPSHITLFRDSDVDPITVGEQIKAVLDFAIAAGAAIDYVQADLDDLDVYLPASEMLDVTCAEVISRCLDYRPDMVVGWSYDAPANDQTIRFVARADLTGITISAEDEAVGTFSAVARYDLQFDGVELYYHWADETFGEEDVFDSDSDSAGTLTGVRVLKQTIPLIGTFVDKSVTIPGMFRLPLDTSATDYLEPPFGEAGVRDVARLEAWNFWGGILTAADIWDDTLFPFIAIDQYSPTEPADIFYGSYDDLMTDISYSETRTTSPDNYVFHTSQAPAETWFYSLFGIRAFTGAVTMQIPTTEFQVGGNFYDFTIGSSDGVYAIDSDSETFSGATYGVADNVPTGLAAILLAALSPLQYAGNIVRLDDLTTSSGICNILHKLNISNTADDLTTMNAVVQSCVMNYLTNHQTRTFGPASHLEPKNFVAIARKNRRRDYNLYFSK